MDPLYDDELFSIDLDWCDDVFPDTTTPISPSTTASLALTTSASDSSDEERAGGGGGGKKRRVILSKNAALDNQSSTEVSVVVPITPTLVLPKILKGDIRRQYARMFANVMDSYDVDLMSSFVKKFTRPDISLHKGMHFVSSGGTKCGGISGCEHNSVELKGKGVIAAFWMMLMKMTPDHIFRVGNMQLITRSNMAGSKLSCDLNVVGTLIYDFSMPRLLQELQSDFAEMTLNKDFDEEDKKISVTSNSNTFDKSKYDPYSRKYPMSKESVRLLETPGELNVIGKLSLYIDENKRIEKFEFISEHVLPPTA